jgi:hypothetical protein
MTDMTASHLSHNTNDSAYIPVLSFTILFGVVTYAAVSVRAVLSPFEVNSFIDTKRGLSVAIGAFILWLSIRAIDRVWGQGPRIQITVLNVAIPGMIGLLLTREAYDLAASGEFAQRFALNLRWMLTWSGYFAAAVAAFLALGYHRQLQAVRDASSAGHEIAPPSHASAIAGYELADLDFDPRRPS